MNSLNFKTTNTMKPLYIVLLVLVVVTASAAIAIVHDSGKKDYVRNLESIDNQVKILSETHNDIVNLYKYREKILLEIIDEKNHEIDSLKALKSI